MKNDFSEPVVKNFGMDVSKKWHIYYRVFNPMTGQTETVRDYAGLHVIKEPGWRYDVAMEKCKATSDRLRSGWRPFDFVHVENMLAYSPERKIYKSYITANSVEAVASEYLQSRKLTDHRRREFMSKLRGFVAWLKSKHLDNSQISLIDNKIVIAFFQFLIDELKLCGATVKKYKHTLLYFWDYVVEKKYAVVNVITNIPDCDRVNDEAAKPIRKEDLEKLWKYIQRDPQLELACKLELFCLMRPGREIRLLKVGMIDFVNSVINLPEEIVKNSNPKRKRSKVTTIPDDVLFDMMDKHRLLDYPADYYVFGKGGVPGTNHLPKNNLWKRFRNIREALGLPNYYKLYSFKHTGVVKLIEMNFHPNEIARQAGWSNTYMLDVYTKHQKVSVNKNIRDNFSF